MSMLRFLPGIIAVQLATATSLVLLGPSAFAGTWPVLLILCGIVAVFAALWFGSIAEHAKKDAITANLVRHAQERETIRVSAEAEKRAALEESHRRILKESARAHSKANFKLGLGLAALIAIGGGLLAIELMTIGLLVMGTAGGALGGYIFRARQDRLNARRDARLVSSQKFNNVALIDAPPTDSPRKP